MYFFPRRERFGRNEEPTPTQDAITEPSWQRTYDRAVRFAKKAGLPTPSPTQRLFWLRVCRLVEIGTLPEGLLADAAAGLAAKRDDVRDPWAYIYGILNTNAADQHKIDLPALLSRTDIPPSILNHKAPAKAAGRT